MVMLFHLILMFIALAEDDQRVRMLIELGNHGARGILYTQFNTTAEPWNKNQTQGEPTNTGMREQYLLGRTLRSTYMYKAPILQEKYDDYQVLIKAAPFPSPIISALSQMMGFYTPGVGDVLTEMEQGIAIPPVEFPDVLATQISDLKDMGLPMYTQVFPIRTNEGARDYLFLPLMHCDIVQEIITNMTNETNWKSLNDHYSTLFKSLEAELNYSLFNLTSATMLYDDVECDFYENKPLKVGLDINVVLELKPVVVDYWKSFIFANEKIRFIANTYMFKEWIEIMNNVVLADNDINMKIDKTLNFALYMGSPYNLYPVLLTLGYNLMDPIGYSGNLLIIMGRKMESLNKQPPLVMSDYEVYVKLNGSVIPTFGELGISADVFIDKLKANSYYSMTALQFSEMCMSVTPKPIPPNPLPKEKNYKLIIGLSIGGGVLLLLVIGGFLWLYIKKRKAKGETKTNYVAAEEPNKESGVQQNTL
jgi:hypothetical protein